MFVLNKSLQTAFTADVHLTGQFLPEYPTHNKKSLMRYYKVWTKRQTVSRKKEINFKTKVNQTTNSASRQQIKLTELLSSSSLLLLLLLLEMKHSVYMATKIPSSNKTENICWVSFAVLQSVKFCRLLTYFDADTVYNDTRQLY